MKTKVRKAVILAAGYGSRFLPATKAIPKEMLPVVDTPGIQLIVEEVVAAGIEQVILITSSFKRAIEDHFDAQLDLERALHERKHRDILRRVRHAQKLANFVFIRQPQPLGTGHAALMAAAAIGDEPFVVLYPDDFFHSKENNIRRMIDVYNEYQAPVMGLFPVPKKDVSRYGIADVQSITRTVFEVRKIIEKPSAREAPSNLASFKGFVLPPSLFSYLKKVKRGRGGEIWLADAVGLYNTKHAVFGCKLSGDRYDLGSKLGWLKANVALSMERPEFRSEMRRFMKRFL